MAASVTTSELRPKLRRGSVIPVTGISPTFMPMLTKDWKNNMPAMPMARYRPKSSRARSETTTACVRRRVKNKMTPRAPTKPSLLAEHGIDEVGIAHAQEFKL